MKGDKPVEKKSRIVGIRGSWTGKGRVEVDVANPDGSVTKIGLPAVEKHK